MGRRKKNQRGALLTAVIFLTAVLWLFAAVSGVERDSGEEGCQQLELALRRAAAACYAAEGSYPPSASYLTEHYGIRIGDGYMVHYDIFASNLMPDITVLEKETP